MSKEVSPIHHTDQLPLRRGTLNDHFYFSSLFKVSYSKFKLFTKTSLTWFINSRLVHMTNEEISTLPSICPSHKLLIVLMKDLNNVEFHKYFPTIL